MKDGIRLHREHGLNPTITQCFWCGKDKNEIALLGAAYRGKAPMHMLLDYEPCDTCKENMGKGIAIIEASETHDGPKFTGRWVVLTEDAARRLFTPSDMVESMLKRRKAYMVPEAFEKLFGDIKEGTEA